MLTKEGKVVSFHRGHSVQCDLDDVPEAYGLDTEGCDGFPDSFGMEVSD